MAKRGRPKGAFGIDRQLVLQRVASSPRAGQNLVQVNQREIARDLGCHRRTVMRALTDLEARGSVRRRGSAGNLGLLVQLLGSDE